MKFRAYSLAAIAASLIAGAAFAQGASTATPAVKPATTTETAKADMSKQPAVAANEKASASKSTHNGKKLVSRKGSSGKMNSKSADAATTEVKPNVDTKVSSVNKTDATVKTTK